MQHKWKGVLVEPQHDSFLSLQKTYENQTQLKFFNVAIDHNEGNRELFKPRRGTRPTSHPSGLARFNRDSLVQKVGNDTDIETETVRCMPLASILTQAHVDHIDLLQIDCEGFDYEIIKMIDFDNMLPRLIHYEHAHLSRSEETDCQQLLIDRGYGLCVERNDTTAYLLAKTGSQGHNATTASA